MFLRLRGSVLFFLFFFYFQTWATRTHDLMAFNLLVIQPAAVFPFNFCFCQLKRALGEVSDIVCLWSNCCHYSELPLCPKHPNILSNQPTLLPTLFCSLVLVPCYNQLSWLQALSSPLQSGAITAGQTNCLFTAAPVVCLGTRRVMLVETLWGA